jgi:tetratricopeptide (TPR) repeat protein
MPEKMLQRFKKENIGVVKSRKADGENKAASGGLFAGMSNKQLQRMIDSGKIQRAEATETKESDTNAPAAVSAGNLETAKKWFEKAQKLYMSEDYKHAAQYYMRSLTYLPKGSKDGFSILFNLAQCNRKLERWPAALEYYQQALELNPETEHKDEVMGHIIAIQSRLGMDVSENGEVVPLEKDEAETIFYMGTAAFNEKRYDDAIKYYTQVLQQFPGVAVTCYINIAQANRKSGRWATALHYYERALQIGADPYTEEIKGRVLECKRKLGLPIVDDKKK